MILGNYVMLYAITSYALVTLICTGASYTRPYLMSALREVCEATLKQLRGRGKEAMLRSF
jgi:hypothetical protein